MDTMQPWKKKTHFQSGQTSESSRGVIKRHIPGPHYKLTESEKSLAVEPGIPHFHFLLF